MLWGIQRGKVVIIAARPSVGKSAFAVQLGRDVALQGKKVMFLSIEMTVSDITERLFCNSQKVNNADLLRGKHEKYEPFLGAFESELKSIKFVISDCIGHNWQDIDELLKSLVELPDVIIIDHINAIKSNGKNTKEGIDDYLTNIVEITKHKNICTIICCQINRDNQKDNDKTPQLHELKGSGNLEEAADVVIMLHWPWRYNQDNMDIFNKYQLIIGKNRNGMTGYLDIFYKPENYLFADIIKEPKPFLRRRLDVDQIDWKE